MKAMEDLEKEGGDLLGGTRSREKVNVKNKLTNLRLVYLY